MQGYIRGQTEREELLCSIRAVTFVSNLYYSQMVIGGPFAFRRGFGEKETDGRLNGVARRYTFCRSTVNIAVD